MFFLYGSGGCVARVRVTRVILQLAVHLHFMWKIDEQKYTFRLSSTKLESNCVSRKWAICTSDRSGVLVLDDLGIDIC